MKPAVGSTTPSIPRPDHAEAREVRAELEPGGRPERSVGWRPRGAVRAIRDGPR